jgi:hypothetical protein
MQKKLIVLLLTLFLLSCKDDNKRAIENKQAVTEKDTITSKLNIETPESVAFNFYKWYLKDIYLKKNVESPEVKLNKDSIYVLDTKKHKKFIEENSFFSKSFYDNEELTFRNCEKELIKVQWKEVEKSGAVNPADFIDGNECGFLNYMVWTNGQGEIINKVEYDNCIIKGKYAYVTLKLSDSLQQNFYSKPKVTMIKENGNWKILKINIETE